MSFLQSVYAKLRRHPKRIVFPDGNDPRVIRAARMFNDRGLGVAVLIGKRQEIEAVAAANDVSLERVAIIDPETSSEMPRFLQLAGSLERYRGMSAGDLRNSLCVPNYFAAMMLQHGLVDGLVGGVGAYSGSLFRPLIQLIKPLSHATVVSSAMIVDVPRPEFGDDGVLFFADCGVVPEPTVPQLASIGVQTGLLARQVFCRRPRIAFLSFSTHGSSSHPAVSKMAAAAVQARQLALQISGSAGLDDLLEIDGELQADAAIVADIARIKVHDKKTSMVAGRANVLIFPDLNSGNIAAKLVHHLSGAKMYGQIILGLTRPAAELSRGTLSEDIASVAAIIGLQAIEYRKLYPLADDLAGTQ
jgi:phosphate acetyltransferase